jgi:hypothetical protein
LALLTGYLAGGVTGMSQTWYIGTFPRHYLSKSLSNNFQVPLQPNSASTEEMLVSTSPSSSHSSHTHLSDGTSASALVAKLASFWCPV